MNAAGTGGGTDPDGRRRKLVSAVFVGILLVAGIEAVVAVVPLVADGEDADERTWRSYESVVAFRNDDVQAHWRSETMRKVDRIFVEEGVPVTLGVIPAIGDRPITERGEVCDYLSERLRTHPELFEVALHGYTHANRTGFFTASEFGGRPYEDQHHLVSHGKRILGECVPRTPTTFVPPFNTYDDDTTRALRVENFSVVSGGPHFSEWYYDRTEPFERSGLYHVPNTAGFVRNWTSHELYDDETLRNRFDRAYGNGSVFVQMIHYQEYNTSAKRAKLRGLIDHMKSKEGVKFVTVGELGRGLDDGTIRRTDDGWEVRERVDHRRSWWRRHSEAVRRTAVDVYETVVDAFQPARLSHAFQPVWLSLGVWSSRG